LTNSSSIFCLISVSSSSSEILSSTYSSLLEWSSTVFCFCLILFYEVFHIFGHFLFNVFFIFIFNSFISVFIVVLCFTLVFI
jgi:hypothetical protein